MLVYEYLIPGPGNTSKYELLTKNIIGTRHQFVTAVHDFFVPTCHNLVYITPIDVYKDEQTAKITGAKKI